MKLFKRNKTKLNPILTHSFKTEKEIQSLVEQNVEELFGLEFVKSELTVKNFRLDSLCFDKENKSFVIIEYKKGTNYSVIDQGYTYLSLLLNNKSDFVLEYIDCKKETLNRKDVDWSQSRIIFISPHFTDYQKHSINFKDVPFELWEVKQYSDDLVGFNKHITHSTESIGAIDTDDNVDTVVKKVTREVKVHTEHDHINQSKVQDAIKELYDELKNRILGLGDDIEVVPRKMYIGYKRKSNFFDVSFLSGYLWCWINLKKGELDDPKNLCRDVSEIGHYGNGDYDISINQDTDLDYLMFLIKQSYNKQGYKK